MTVELLLPGRRISAPKPPSRIALDMAFGVGNPAILGDKSRYRSHGAITTATPVAGVHGLCLDFVRATPDYVEIPAANCPQLNFIAEDFSIVIRFRPDIVAGMYLLNRGFDSVDGWRVYPHGTGRIYFSTSTAPAFNQSATSVGSYAAGNWYTLGISRAGASGRLWLNGVEDTNIAGVHADLTPCARSMKIGIYDDLVTLPFDGLVEFLRIFRGIALQPSEHLAWHNALA